MKRIFVIFAALAAFSASEAQAAGCYADYKARRSQSGQMELHYGVIELGARACGNRGAAEQAVARRIGRDGWQLLRVLSTFDQNGLNQRRGNAGNYFLRY